jgi:8-oxo-dGTP diphosphatase
MLRDMTNTTALRSQLERVIQDIVPFDDLEAEHRANAVDWVCGVDQIYRTRKPAVPPKHLVAYFAVVDVHAGRILLVDHINAGLWLPTGGHVEPEEDPLDTVTRELGEELGVTGPLVDGLSSNPLFVTQTTTVGNDAGHVDVSLWYVVAASVDDRFEPDPGEFHGVRWWSWSEVHAAPADTLDPQLPRFVRKLQRDLAR